MRKTVFIFLFFLVTSSFATEKWEIFETEYKGPKVDNPFADVWLNAEFTFKNHTYFVDGFYDGDQTYKIRFMPEFEGKWTYTVFSNIPSLNEKKEVLSVHPPSLKIMDRSLFAILFILSMRMVHLIIR
ncbi:DUF5060 domain-containing protein [Maribacter halichondriae]|uniref:DUF5060 domain-containing protein n=1 Tax=Maribacter halichondriae TaxID=2980554 RepID=UPI002359F1DD|nr:DUF5060 domain-containing protein [Maribacter sp. Hal144]